MPKLVRNINNLMDLTTALLQEWNNIPDAIIFRYVESMWRRIFACIDCRGGNKKCWLKNYKNFKKNLTLMLP